MRARGNTGFLFLAEKTSLIMENIRGGCTMFKWLKRNRKSLNDIAFNTDTTLQIVDRTLKMTSALQRQVQDLQEHAANHDKELRSLKGLLKKAGA